MFKEKYDVIQSQISNDILLYPEEADKVTQKYITNNINEKLLERKLMRNKSIISRLISITKGGCKVQSELNFLVFA